MKKIILVLLAITTVGIANAQTPVSITGTTYTQNFNLLDSVTSVSSSNMPAGWSIYEKGTSATSVDQKYKAGTGSSNAGDTYSFGTLGNVDRALGSVASSSNTPSYGVLFTNNSGATITSINIQFYVEQWRHSKDTLVVLVADSLGLDYSTNATAINDSMASWLSSSIFAVSPQNTYNTAATALNGNLSANRTLVTGTIMVTVPAGGSVALRFKDIRVSTPLGNDGLAVDDLSLTFGTGVVNMPILTSTTPVDNSTGVAIGTSNLTVTFDKNITIGTGNIYVNNISDATQQTIAVGITSVAGVTATIPGVVLLANKMYAVQYDSTCYKNGSFNGVGIYNNTAWNFQTLNPKPLIVTKTPADNATNISISTTSISLDFDKNITAGTGNVYVKNLTDVTSQTIAIGSCTVSGINLSIPSVTLLVGKSYAVQYDSTAVTANSYNAIGIYDTTTWNFSTVPAIAPPVNSLNETFTTCLAPALGAFTQTSSVGNATWKCTTFGHNDANAVNINGGITLGDNTDWLVSPTMNVSAMANPMLSFWAKRRFAGSTLKEVYVSANYTGDVATATWAPLNVSNFATLDTTGWNAFNNTSLMMYKANNFHFAFKYTATVTAASDELTIDDVTITDGPVSTSSIQLENMNVAVLGTANDGLLNIAIDAKSPSNYSVRIMDVLGNTIYNGAINATIGKNKYSIQLPAVSNGVYVMTIGNAASRGSVKFTKQ
jgi:hypothetical protein